MSEIGGSLEKAGARLAPRPMRTADAHGHHDAHHEAAHTFKKGEHVKWTDAQKHEHHGVVHEDQHGDHVKVDADGHTVEVDAKVLHLDAKH